MMLQKGEASIPFAQWKALWQESLINTSSSLKYNSWSQSFLKMIQYEAEGELHIFRWTQPSWPSTAFFPKSQGSTFERARVKCPMEVGSMLVLGL